MKAKILKIFVVTALLFCLVTSMFGVSADGKSNGVYSDSSFSYIYGKGNNGTYVVPSPSTFLTEYVVDSDSLGKNLNNPQHIINDSKGNYYIVNTGDNNIIITDKNFNHKKTLKGFKNKAGNDTFSQPYGCFVTKKGDIYIADTGNQRIVILDKKYKLKSIIEKPEDDVLSDDFKFEPQKVVVDSAGRIFVVAKGAYEGIMQFYHDGSFIGYIGSISVEADSLEIIWKKLLSSEQAKKREQFIPVTYTNIFLDSEEFLYTVSLSKNTSTPIRRLNPGGTDVLSRNGLNSDEVKGDLMEGVESQFMAICADKSGVYYAADSSKNRIFAYDEDGNLLSAFGSRDGQQDGNFRNVSSMLSVDDYLLVVDSISNNITALKKTEYMDCIIDGLTAYRNGDYKEGKIYWENVISLNSNFDLAYSKLGMIEIRNGNYKTAMEYFKIADDKENYSRAYVKDRRIWYVENLSKILTVLAVVVVLIVGFVIYRKRRNKK